MDIVTNNSGSDKYRVMMSAVDMLGIGIRPVWYGTAETANGAVERAKLEAKENGWSDVYITKVFVRRKEKPPVAAGGIH